MYNGASLLARNVTLRFHLFEDDIEFWHFANEYSALLMFTWSFFFFIFSYNYAGD